MSKAGAWSYSRMKGFETCPKQYYHVNVLKEYPFEETVATRYGNEFHKAAELYIKDNQPVPGKFAEFEPILQSLRDKPGDKHCELKLGLTADLEPCGFFAKNVWFRGVVDLLIIDGDRAFIVDYKTGKSAKYADPDQLELMALTVFAHYPQVKEAKAGLVFVIADTVIKENYDEGSRQERWARWVTRYAAMQKAHETEVFNPRPSGLCRAHCPVVECAHNGKNG
jgi:hypothetical protein